MSNDTKLVIISTSFYNVIFRLKEGFLQNVFFENQQSLKINSIYLAKVNELSASLGGAFVSLGENKQAFLKLQKNKNNIKVGEKILVQVVKQETIPNKLAVVSTDINIRGALAVFKPFMANIIFSKKLTENDKKQIIEGVSYNKEQDNYGLIVRSLYKHNLLSDLILEVNYLKSLWKKIKSHNKVGLILEVSSLENIILANSKNAPSKIISSSIQQNNKVKEVISKYKVLNIKSSVYTQKEDILDYYNINEYIQDAFSNNLIVNDSLNIIFYEQESFNYIDVNFSGESSYASKEEVAYKANVYILPIIVKHILLRNLSGQIFIDILKVTNKQYRNNIINLVKNLLNEDEVKSTVLGFSNLGLLELSRQKIQDSFALNSKKLDYNLHCLVINLQKIQASNKNEVSVVISSNHLNQLKSLAKEDLEKLSISINFKINENINIPKIEE